MSNIDQSLDDIIKSNKSGARAGGGRRRRGGGARVSSGPMRNAPNRLGARHTPYSIGKPSRRRTQDGAAAAVGGAWQHDMFDEVTPFRGGGRPLGIETGTKLYISNLDHGVSTEDIKELFSANGDLKKCTVHFDKSGRSKCTAEVVFARKVDAQKAMKQYNNVQLDGKPMKIECVGTNIVTAFANGNSNDAAAAAAVAAVSAPSGRGRGGGGGGRIGKRLRRKPAVGGGGGSRGGRGGGKGGGGEKSAQELDADLDSYHAEAMQT